MLLSHAFPLVYLPGAAVFGGIGERGDHIVEWTRVCVVGSGSVYLGIVIASVVAWIIAVDMFSHRSASLMLVADGRTAAQGVRFKGVCKIFVITIKLRPIDLLISKVLKEYHRFLRPTTVIDSGPGGNYKTQNSPAQKITVGAILFVYEEETIISLQCPDCNSWPYHVGLYSTLWVRLR